MRVADVWGTTDEEQARSYPCDALMADFDADLFRAVDVDAPASVLHRWLCQLALAPYSYDWIDNFGRRSPRHLVEGVDDLVVGQRMCSIFTLASFERDAHLTLQMSDHPVFGDVVISYVAAPVGNERSRLLAKLRVRYPRVPIVGLALRLGLPWGDLIMMRRQLLNFKQLAETSRWTATSNA